MEFADRHAELVSALREVDERIAQACRAYGRNRDDVTMIAVTKTYPISDAMILARLGVCDMAENRVQQGREKAVALPEVRWHFVGQLQRNKCRLVAGYATALHSVDRPELVAALTPVVLHRTEPLEIFIQVNLDSEQSRGLHAPRGGILPTDVLRLADLISQTPQLHLHGVMTVAPRDEAPEIAFEKLAAISVGLQKEYPDAKAISAGMSGDLEIAIQYGATHVRVGSALLGIRRA